MSSQAQPIYLDQDFYAPTFEVYQGGKRLPQTVLRDISEVSFHDDVEQIDTFELTLNNWDSDARDYKYSDDDRFDPGRDIVLWMGYLGKGGLRRMISGKITTLQPTFPAAGRPTLKVGGVNLLHDLRTKQESKRYVDRTDSQIAREIGVRLGVEMEIDREAEQQERPYPYLVQKNEFSINFLIERARRIGYDLYVTEVDTTGSAKPSALHFGPSVNTRDPIYELTYGRTLSQFQPTLSTANQVSKVTVRGWDKVNKDTIEYTARRSELRTRGVRQTGQGPVDAAIAKQEEVVVCVPVLDRDEARQLAIQILERNAKQLVRGSGSTVGMPDLRAGRVVLINGLDRPKSARAFYDGHYFLTSTTHRLGPGGYTTEFHCRLEEIG